MRLQPQGPQRQGELEPPVPLFLLSNDSWNPIASTASYWGTRTSARLHAFGATTPACLPRIKGWAVDVRRRDVAKRAVIMCTSSTTTMKMQWIKASPKVATPQKRKHDEDKENKGEESKVKEQLFKKPRKYWSLSVLAGEWQVSLPLDSPPQ
ncbi:uncharacterized protein LOC144544217 isoform X2 [Carex rostrata]